MTATEWLHDKWSNCKEWKWEEIEQWFEQAKEIEYKQSMDAMQIGMELQEKENNRVGFRERNGLIISATQIENEIKKRYETTQNDAGFRDGVYWCLEQLNNLKLK